MPNTPVLQLPVSVVGGRELRSYPDRVSLEAELSSSHVAVDAFAALTTGSACFSMFSISGSVSDNLGDAGGMGAEFNRSCDRVIQEVVAFAATSGSGGVTTIDVLVQQGAVAPANFSTIFASSNNADRLALSSSLGNYGVAKKAAFVSGSNMVWPAGTLLKAQLITAAGAAGVSGQKGLVVQVFWKPSGSFGA